MAHVILATASRQRIELFKTLGVPFKAEASRYEENMSLELPDHKLARVLSAGKAQDVARRFPDAFVIGIDTFVVFQNTRLGKPHTPQKAREMLRMLSGKTNLVLSGVTMILPHTKKVLQKTVETKVVLRNLSDNEINWYVASGEPLTKAGAYAIQGKGMAFVKKISGDYSNVIGLPLPTVIEMLQKARIPLMKAQI